MEPYENCPKLANVFYILSTLGALFYIIMAFVNSEFLNIAAPICSFVGTCFPVVKYWSDEFMFFTAEYFPPMHERDMGPEAIQLMRNERGYVNNRIRRFDLNV